MVGNAMQQPTFLLSILTPKPREQDLSHFTLGQVGPACEVFDNRRSGGLMELVAHMSLP